MNLETKLSNFSGTSNATSSDYIGQTLFGRRLSFAFWATVDNR